MKVIFLDIDGVLNSQCWYQKRMDIDKLATDIDSQYPMYEFDPEAVLRLNSIIEKTDAKVVISSTWRIGRTVKQLQTILESVGFVGEVIDKTVSLNATVNNENIGYRIPRGCEIDFYLKKTGDFQRINWSKEVQRECIDKAIVKNYIILDDDSDMLYGQREHFIHTSNNTGLTDALMNKGIETLNKNLIELYYNK